MPRLRLETFIDKVHKGEWGGKKAPKTLYCPKDKGVMNKCNIRKDFISGDGVDYICSRESCEYVYRTIVNTA